MSGHYEAFRYYLDENRIATSIHAYKRPENISLHLNLSHHNDVEFLFKMCRDSRVEDAYFMAGRDRFNKAKEKDHIFWKTGWEQFARLFSAMLTDVNKPASAFPKSRGLSNRDVLKLTKLCRQYRIRFYMNKDLDGAYLQLGQQKYYHAITAEKALEAIIMERSFVYRPSFKV